MTRLPVLLLLLPCLPCTAMATVTRQEATAVAAGTGALLYRESHWRQGAGEGAARLVLYRCADGRAFARKWMPATTQATAPGFEFEDARSGREEAVRGAGRDRDLLRREDRSVAAQQTSLRVPLDGVVDAGFDAAVRHHWDTLQQGKPIGLPFLLSTRARWIPLQVRRTGSLQWQGQAAERLQMKLDAWFGFAVPDVELVYATTDRRLLQFTGTSNLRFDGGYPRVRIAFPNAPVSASGEELQHARTQALAGSCA